MDKMTAVLEALAAKLGTTVEHLWPLLVQRTRVVGIVDAVVCVFVLALLTGGWVWFWCAKARAESYDDWPAFVGVIGGSVTLIVLLAVMVCASGIVARIVQPEASTIVDLLDKMGQ